MSQTQLQILQSCVQTSQRLDSFLAETWSQYFSRTQAQKIIHDGSVFVNEKKIEKTSFLLQENDAVSVNYFPPQVWHLQANYNLHLPIVFQDEFFAVVHKPAGMTVHPGAGTKDDTLVHALLAQLKNLSDGSTKERPGIVHRLDRDTEGLLLVAKTNHAHARLASLFEQHKIQKEYKAWLCGFPPSENDKKKSSIDENNLHDKKIELEGYIQRHPSTDSSLRKLMLFSQTPLHERAKYAHLSYRIEKKIFPFAQVSIDLHTGRTHQIRAAFKYLNTPVVNDNLYGKQFFFTRHNIGQVQKEELQKNGLLLIAHALHFVHPYTREEMSFSLASLPRFDEFEKQILSLFV